VAAPVTGLEADAVIWLNGFVGTWQAFDDMAVLVASDYLLPLLFSLALLAVWFAGRSPAVRERNQIAVLTGMAALGVGNALVALVNLLAPRPRPFVDHGDELELLFYRSTDPSFPANPVVVGFAVGTALWRVNRALGAAICAGGLLIGLARVYAGVFYPTDIVGGVVLGIAVTYFIDGIRRLIEPLPTLAIKLARAFALG
jgi:undecaprenyl-diphosphatase